jgi:hypothetical protein
MCGIFGTFSNFTIDTNQTKVFEDMLRVGVVRGEDGTGLMSVSPSGKHKMAPDYIKIGGNPYDLMRDKIFAPFMSKMGKAKIMVGHHRAATKGAINTDNSHPFMNDHITMVHNGTIREGIDMKKYKVDSDGLCALVAEKGPKEAFGSISGAYACVWWDDEQQNLFFLKNDERPLHMVHVRTNTYFASEAGMLSWILYRNINSLKPEEVKVITLENNYLYSLDKNNFPQKGEYIPKKLVSGHGTSYGHSKASTLYLPPTTTPPNKNGDKDFRADFVIFEERGLTDKWGVVYWQYVCYSDDYELLFLNTRDRIPPEFHNEDWHGQLIPGPRTGMVEGYGTDVIFYQLREGTVVRIIKADKKDTKKLTEEDKKAIVATLPQKITPVVKPVDKTLEQRVKTLDGFMLTAARAREMCKENCAVCDAEILIAEVPKCVTMTSRTEVPLGLFCVKCTDECIQNVKKETVQ